MNIVDPAAFAARSAEREYFAHLAQGRFMLQRARRSGRIFFYPRVAEPLTGHRDLQWVPAAGTGTVHATTTVRPKPPERPYNVVIVELDEGPRLMSRVEGLAPDAVCIGLRVRARIATDGGQPLVVFDPLESSP